MCILVTQIFTIPDMNCLFKITMNIGIYTEGNFHIPHIANRSGGGGGQIR